jgi:hypothetical protein
LPPTRLFENKILWGIFESEREEEAGDRRKMQNKIFIIVPLHQTLFGRSNQGG